MMNNLTVRGNYSKKLNEHSIMMMHSMPMCCLLGTGGMPM
jgi:hypothetical protein